MLSSCSRSKSVLQPSNSALMHAIVEGQALVRVLETNLARPELRHSFTSAAMLPLR